MSSAKQMPEGWVETTLGELAIINPRESLTKGTININVPMDCIDSYSKKIQRYNLKEFVGGTKFRNGDTLLARITPCLENGKTAFVDILKENEIGFGSTEYIIIREKEDISDKHFLFYLSISPRFREVAIKAMTGTSGRQRVQNEMLVNYKFTLPKYKEQKSIAAILTAFDDKIELLQAQNKTLEETAQTIFKEWFGKVSEDWKVIKISKLLEITSSKRIFYSEYVTSGIPFYRSKEIIELSTKPKISTELFITEERYHDIKVKFEVPKKGDILLTAVGTLGVPFQIRDNHKFYFKDGNLIWFKNFDKTISSDYVYNWLKLKSTQDKLNTISIGSTQKALTITSLKELEIPFITSPQKRNLFYEFLKSNLDKVNHNQAQIQTLTQTRDELLPKLMSSEIRVKMSEL